MIKNPSDESAARPLVSLQMRNACEAQSGFRVSFSNASPYPVQKRSVGTIAASTISCLRTTAALCSTWHYTLLLLYNVSEQNRSYENVLGFVLTSDLQQQRSSFMIHPSGHPAA